MRPSLAQKTLLAILLIAGLTACNTTPRQAITPTTQASLAAEPSVTSTVAWFPATSTSTPPATPLPATATPIPPTPFAGNVILQDDFTNPALWLSGEFEAGTIAYGKDELDLAISEERGSLTSWRMDPVLSDFYLEITLAPSMCLNNDNFGVLFRVSDASNFYRYIQSCTGQLRLERLKGGVGQVLHDWSASAQALPNTNGTYKLGIWVKGSDLRFYIDDVFQFSVKDASLTSGGLGLYARSMGTNPVTVAFSNLVIYQPGSTTLATENLSPSTTP